MSVNNTNESPKNFKDSAYAGILIASTLMTAHHVVRSSFENEKYHTDASALTHDLFTAASGGVTGFATNNALQKHISNENQTIGFTSAIHNSRTNDDEVPSMPSMV